MAIGFVSAIDIFLFRSLNWNRNYRPVFLFYGQFGLFKLNGRYSSE